MTAGDWIVYNCLMRRLLIGLLVATVVTTLTLEAMLQAASLFAPDRSGTESAGDQIRILCLGDSHTFGVMVEEGESYPAQVQQQLHMTSPGRFSVINLGIPGMNSSQIRKRLAKNVQRYDPQLVIVWVGVNDQWNRSDVDGDASWPERVEVFAGHSRLYRLARVWVRDREIGHAVADARGNGVHQAVERENWVLKGENAGATWTIRHGDETEIIENRGGAEGTPNEAPTYRNLSEIANWLRGEEIPLLLVRYPLNLSHFLAPNQAAEQVSRDLAVPLVNSNLSIKRIPREQREWTKEAHPGPNVYHEIAIDVVKQVQALKGTQAQR